VKGHPGLLSRREPWQTHSLEGGPDELLSRPQPVEARHLEVDGNLTVYGSKAAAVPHPDGSIRRLYAVESPESWFDDFGEAVLRSGRARVRLDPDYAALIEADAYQVFLTSYGPAQLYVDKRTPEEFEVRAMPPDDREEIPFGYRIVGRRLNAPGERLEQVSRVERELPQQPEPPVMPPKATAPPTRGDAHD
jgi:hypothetical protein